MNVLVVYDSWYGNTEQLARAIADRLGSARLVKAKALGSLDLAGCDLLVIGSPTHAGGISLGLRFAVPRIPAAVVRGVSVAAFDTRFHEDVSHTGSAAVKIAKSLEKKGARLVAPPESFFVSGMKGPLEEGEIERASAWAATILGTVQAAPQPDTPV